MKELTDIDGIGNTIEEQLNDLGITSVNQLANTDDEILADANIRNYEKIIKRVRKHGVTIDSGKTIEKQHQNSRYITTGINALDDMLGSGYQGGFLIGISGESQTGKTQLAFQGLASAADNHDGHAVYIETEPKRFHIERVKTLCKNNDSYKKIHRIKAHDPDPEIDNIEIQRNSYEAVRETFNNVSLVVLDSFQSNFRISGLFSGREKLPDRNQKFADHLDGLQGLANDLDCPILITLQVQGNPEPYAADHNVWGPMLMDHQLTYRLELKFSKGDKREVQLKGHPGLPNGTVELEIPENAPIRSA